MKILQRLINMTFKGSKISEKLYEDKRMTEFIEGDLMKLTLISDGKTVTFPRGNEKGGKVLHLERRNKDKLNPRRLCFDLSTSVYSFGSKDKNEDTNVALASIFELKNRFSTESAIMTKNMAKEQLAKKRAIQEKSFGFRGIAAIYKKWKKTYKETLDSELKTKMVYYIGIWESLEKDLRILNTPCISNKIKFDWALDIINFSCSCLYSMITNDTELAPNTREIKQIASGVASDFIARSEEEYQGKKWWLDENVIERAKKWIELFKDLEKLLNENISIRLGQDYKDPQIETQTKVLEMMISVYEILKQARKFKIKNKILQEEYEFFLRILIKSRGDLIKIHKQLLKSDLLIELLKELKKTIRELTNSDQTFNTLNFLTRTSTLVLSHQKYVSELEEERFIIASKVRNLLENIQSEYNNVLDRAIKYESNVSSIGDGNIDHRVLIDILKELVSFSRKFKMIGQFLIAFFKEDKKHLKKMPKTGKMGHEIKKTISKLVSVWDNKAKEVIEGIRMEMDDTQLLELDMDAGVMTTNFPDELDDLIHFTDVLKEMGYESNISMEVKSFTEEKKGIYNQALKLKKITEFYNSLVDLDSVLLKCHRPLLLDRVISLENLVKNADTNLEDDPQKLADFITQAEQIIDGFKKLNSTLKNYHNEIINDFISLYDMDLISKKYEWKNIIGRAKSKVDQITKEIGRGLVGKISNDKERAAFQQKFTSYKAVWTNYLSWQLLKVLTHQLKRTLLRIAHFIPKIDAKVRLSRGKIVVTPSIQEIRSKVYDYINSMISFPKSLKFFRNWEFFLEFIPSQSKKCLRLAYAEADRVVSSLDKKLAELKDWVALANFEPLKVSQNQNMNKGEVWKKIVEVLRSERRNIELHEEYLDADCVKLSIENFKYQVEEKISQVLAQVMNHLDNSLSDEHDQVTKFLDEMTEKLDKQPKSADELREAWTQFDDLQEKTEEFKPVVNSLKDKIELIVSLGRVQSRSSDILEKWDKFEIRVKNFKQELREKQQNMRQEMENQVEDMKTEVEKFESKWQSSKLRDDETITRRVAKDYLIVLNSIKGSWEEFEKKMQGLKKDLDHFGMECSELELAEVVGEEIQKEIEEWEMVKKFEEELAKLEARKHVGNSKTIFDFQDMMVDWQNRVKTKKSRVGIYLKATVDDFQGIWPGLKLMIGEAFQREHWNHLMYVLEITGITMDNLTFGHLIKNHKKIYQKMDALRELSARAQGEVTIREAIEELDNWCTSAEFELIEYKDIKKNNVPLISEWNDMMSRVGDNQALLQSIKDSKFYSRFKDRILQFDKRIGGLDSYLTKIQTIQRRWLYLEPIFGKGALPSQQERFDNLNNQFQGIMRNIQKIKKIALMNEISGLEKNLENIIEQIEICQHALNKFLEETRNRFPRFFFLGDDDLLEILGQSENPRIIKMHLKKIFAGIYDVEFKQSGKNLDIVSMIASSGETVPLKKKVEVSGNLEEWLRQLAKQMFETLQDLLVQCIKEKQFSISRYPGQILSISKEIEFTNKVHSYLEKNKLDDLKEPLNKFLQTLTSAKSKLGKIDQKKTKNLIMNIIHQISIVDEMIEHKVYHPKNWNWFKQLKYSLNRRTKKAEIAMCKSSFDYTYEYQGNPSKLVHTPLTDKCYLTLTQGMMLGFGGNPYGPAGTGKTESVKALGGAFGRMVLVFNCDENLDYRSMGRIFIGLVKCGAWGCFDEFNRLYEEQLSAISQQIQLIQDAIKEKKKDLHLLGLDISVDFNAGIFVTLNPAGKGYGGRSKLPDNLKLLFRPVAMSRPNNELIAEVMLYAEGFTKARILSNKVVGIFGLSSQILSNQQHYDWGLRALKTILTTAGELIQKQREKNGTEDEDPRLEAEVLLKALKDNTTSKLTSSDLEKFNLLINDVMPNVRVPEIKDEDLLEAIEKSLLEQNLDIQDRQISKILQFNSALRQRMGVVIMGPSGSGKTTIWRVLRNSFKKLGKEVKTYIMNPKAISRKQLLGHMDVNTREFKDGVLTAAARKAIKEQDSIQNWIICDGDVDPKWIEALNSVLDDNHLLTLPTGERISFGDNVNFIFETHDLKYASPATVSRMGMIYLNDDDVNISSLVSKWKRDQNLGNDEPLSNYLDDFFEPVLKLLRENEEEQCVRTTQMGAILNLLSQVKGTEHKKEFSISLMRGLIANFPTEKREELIQSLQGILGERLSFVHWFDPKKKALFPLKSEQTNLKNLRKGGQICVKTAYVQANLKIILKSMNNNDSLILVGPQGVGKNLMIGAAIKKFSQSTRTKVSTIYCNSQTNSSQIIDSLMQSCTRTINSQGPILRPKDCNRLIILLRDINLAKPDEYESIELISFLQQLHSHRGFYDENLEFTQIDQNIQFLVSMNPSSDVGRHEISTRLTANMRILFIDYPETEDMKSITKDLASGTLRESSTISKLLQKNSRLGDSIAGFLLELFSFVKANFTPERQKHYHYTPKDISKILKNMLSYEIESRDDLAVCLYEESKLLFRNRLVGNDEVSKYDNLVRKLMTKYLQFSLARSDFEFSSFVKRDGFITKLPKSDYVHLLEKTILSYERENIELGMCLAPQTILIVLELEKILCKNGAKALLIGNSGSGRKLLTRLICHTLNIEVETFSISNNYNVREFRKELRRIIEVAGVQGKKVCMLLEDHHIIKDSFLEDINSLLSSNEIPGLITQEEVELMLKDQSDILRNEFYGNSVYECFLLRIEKNLKVVLSLDSKSSKLGHYLTNNPAILKKCEIYWMRKPTNESLKLFAKKKLNDCFLQNFGGTAPEELYDSMIEIHNSTSHAPREFFALIEAYKLMVGKKVQELKARGTHLKSGLDKIGEANKTVDKLSEQAAVQKRELKVKQAEAEKFLKQIEQTYESASDQKREAEEIRKFLKKEESKTIDKRMAIEKELKEVQPIVDEAKKQIGKISKRDITELKSYSTPPTQVKDVFYALFILMGEGEVSWSFIKKALSKASFLDSVMNINARSIKKKDRAKVKKYISKNSGSFEKEQIYRVSMAAGPIADYLKAVVKLSETYANIKPLEDQMAKVDKKLAGSKRALAEKDKELNKIEDKVAELKKTFGEKTAEAETLKMALKEAEDRIKKATVLLSKLAGEKSRWQSSAEHIQQDISVIPRDALLATGFITYLALGSEDKRNKYMDLWKDLLDRKDFQFTNFMADESKILEYISEGLPPDQLAKENSLVVQASVRAPLVIDPNNNFSTWLLNSYSKRKDCDVLFSQNKKLLNALELGIRFGKTVIVKEVDNVDSLYFSLLKKDLMKVGPRMVVQLGEKFVDWNDNFKLIFLSRNHELKLEPFAGALVNEVNNLVTAKGLEQKLLSIVINNERPDIEEKKKECLEQERTLKIDINRLEEQLLNELASSEGNILENVSLLNSLNDTKVKSTKIEESLQKSKELQESLEKERSIYIPLAEVGTRIYLKMNSLSQINHMYSFSLEEYTKVFKLNLESRGGGMGGNNGILELIRSLSRGLFKSTFTRFGYCMFKKDKLCFALHLIKEIEGMCTDLEYSFFLGRANVRPSRISLPSWANESSMELLSKYNGAFSNIVRGLKLENDIWQRWHDALECEKRFPSKIMLKPFQKVILTQIFRPDRLERSLEDFVCYALGLNNLNEGINSVSAVYSVDNSPDVPILFITSLGSDPSKELFEFAVSQVGKERFVQLSMGGGQNEKAMKLLNECATEGKWLFFKNLHLVPAFLVDLEKELKKIEKHKSFKLWLTTEEQKKFPVVLLETCFKVSYESPPGVKMNVERVYLTVSNTDFRKFTDQKARMIFLLAYFHAILQERRTYIPQGWSKYYEFSQSDFKAGSLILDTIMNEDKIDWPGLFGLIENAIYGGRIDKTTDMEILRAYMRKIFNSYNLQKNDLKNGITAPPSRHLKDHLKTLKHLPDVNKPEVFGLPDVIESSLQRSNVIYTVNKLKSLGMKTVSSGDSMDTENMAIAVGPILNLWKNLLSKIMGTPELTAKVNQYSEDVMICTIQEELAERQKMIKKIGGLFKRLDEVISGTGSMTSQLQTFAESLIKNQLPSIFEDIWDGCIYPDEWIKIIGKKTLGLKLWIDAIKKDSLYKERLPLGSFIDPEVVLNSLRQKTCRKLKTSLDKLVLTTQFLEPSKDVVLSINVGDLVLEGSGLESSCVEFSAKAPEKTRVRSTFIGYAEKSDINDFSDKIEIPIYLSRDKELFLCMLKCAFMGERDDIILGGTSFYLI